jgi:hypothetical protein
MRTGGHGWTLVDSTRHSTGRFTGGRTLKGSTCPSVGREVRFDQGSKHSTGQASRRPGGLPFVSTKNRGLLVPSCRGTENRQRDEAPRSPHPCRDTERRRAGRRCPRGGGGREASRCDAGDRAAARDGAASAGWVRRHRSPGSGPPRSRGWDVIEACAQDRAQNRRTRESSSGKRFPNLETCADFANRASGRFSEAMKVGEYA